MAKEQFGKLTGSLEAQGRLPDEHDAAWWKNQHDQKKAELDALHPEHDRAAKEAAEIKESWKNEVHRLTAAHNEECKRQYEMLSKSHQAEQERLSKSIAAGAEQLAKAKKDLSDVLEARVSQLQALEEKHKADCESLAKAATDAASRMAANHDAEIKRLKAECQKAVSDAYKDTPEAKAKREKAAKLKAEYEKKHAELVG